jgi:hypothetical protein
MIWLITLSDIFKLCEYMYIRIFDIQIIPEKYIFLIGNKTMH